MSKQKNNKPKHDWAAILRSKINSKEMTDEEVDQAFNAMVLSYIVPETQEQTIELLKSIPEEDFKLLCDAIRKMNEESEADDRQQSPTD